MSAQDSKTLSVTAPLALLVFGLKIPHGFSQTVATVVAVTATILFIQVAARFLWTPVFRRGLRWATLVLCGVIVAGLLTTMIAGAMKLGESNGFARNLTLHCAIAGLLFSWGLAAFHGAREKERLTTHRTQRLPSVLFRPPPPPRLSS